MQVVWGGITIISTKSKIFIYFAIMFPDAIATSKTSPSDNSSHRKDLRTSKKYNSKASHLVKRSFRRDLTNGKLPGMNFAFKKLIKVPFIAISLFVNTASVSILMNMHHVHYSNFSFKLSKLHSNKKWQFTHLTTVHYRQELKRFKHFYEIRCFIYIYIFRRIKSFIMKTFFCFNVYNQNNLATNRNSLFRLDTIIISWYRNKMLIPNLLVFPTKSSDF